ncbi:hypothetical protein [Hymenobacter terricola]|uniref:hypothetical protein n=1 Tax=Hymenobacter terricola TaxID=2819236 RepID=UPI001B308434|nr:hypothetical protein [Hymenobacter terricola]
MRFLALLACFVLIAASGLLSLLLGPVSYAKLQSLGQLLYLEDAFARLPLALTPARYAALRGLLFGTLGGSLLAGLSLLRHPANRAELRGLRLEINAAWASLRATIRNLTKVEMAVGLGLLGLVLGVRAGLLLGYGFRYDELLSYLFFVREGPVVTSSFYPLPNNHIFFNLCCALGRPVLGQHPLLLMRLPSYGVAALGTALSYALLARFTNFRLATLVTGLFNLTPAALYYAASGRGYYMQLVLIQLGFFAVVGLGAWPHYRRLAWLVFVVSSVLGLYTIPTYAYPLASLALGAALVLAPIRGQKQWLELLLTGLLIGITATLLYAPVGAVSGWPRLLANSYVVPASWATFRASALANIYEKTQELFGVVRPVLLLGGALAALVPLALWRARLPALERSLAGVTWALLVVPALVIMAQRTYPPTRAVVYLAYFGFLLGALALWFVAGRWRGFSLSKPQQLGLIGMCVVAAGALRFDYVLARIYSSRHEEIQLTQAWRWLAARKPKQVLLGSYEAFFYYYAVQDHQRVELANRPAPGRRYDYLVLPPRQESAPAWARSLGYQPVFRNDLVSIFALAPLPARPH